MFEESAYEPLKDVELHMDVYAVLRLLTPDQREICNEIMSGVPLKEIAGLRGVSYKTLKRKLRAVAAVFRLHGMGKKINL